MLNQEFAYSVVQVDGLVVAILRPSKISQHFESSNERASEIQLHMV